MLDNPVSIAKEVWNLLDLFLTLGQCILGCAGSWNETLFYYICEAADITEVFYQDI